MRPTGSRFVRCLRHALCLAGLVGVLAPRPALSACDQSQLFQTPTFRFVGTKVNRAILLDVNHDGILDLIMCNPDSLSGTFGNTVSVMLGTGSGGVGDGSFGSPTAYPVQTRPVNLTAADFDGDGVMDLAVTNWASNSVSIVRGLGNGTFSAPTNYAVGLHPYTPIAGDFNHDGILDLAVAENGVAAVTVLLGLGSGGVWNGSFATPVTYPLAGLSLSMVAGDVNEDGNLDLIATQDNLGVAVLLGNPNGTFAPAHGYLTGPQAFNMVLRDLDGDSHLDLAVSNTASGGVAFLKGTGTGAFSTPTTYLNGVNADGIVAADFDGDGIADLAVSSTATNTVVVLKGLGVAGVGNGTFVTHSSYAVTNAPNVPATADLNGDGKPDLVVPGFGTGLGASILLGTCVGPPPGPPPGAPHLVSVRDVPGDQGGHVFLRWTRSVFDTTGITLINGYRVWRRLPPMTAAAARQAVLAGSPSVIAKARPGTGIAGATVVDYWEAIATLPAEQLAGYGYTAATTQDSLPGSNPYTAYFVTALTANPGTFYESNVDSGYSVDNLAPPMPAPFAASYTATSNALHWGSSPAPDLAEFLLYRGLVADFVPGPGNAVAATRDTGYMDTPGAYFYKLFALDVHGNLSHYAMVSPQNPVSTLASLVSADVREGQVRLTWYSAGNAAIDATVYRRTLDTGWAALGTISADGSGYLRFEDDAVATGTRYGYRLGIQDAGSEVFAGETWVTPASLQLALEGSRPNPSSGGVLTVQFVLPSSAAARLELFDVAGRRVTAREVGSLGPGRHSVDLAQGVRIPAGRYVLRLSQGAAVKSSSAVVLD